MSNSEEKGDDKKEDRISKLPNDILICNILSHMELIDATRTSILSTTWRYFSTYLTSLNFDGSKKTTLSCRFQSRNLFKHDAPKFVNWVNQVVNLHRASFINEFRVCFQLDKTRTNEIDSWVKFAISKKVKKLELDFTDIRANFLAYTLQSNTLNCDSNGITFLTSLCLSRVNISGELLELVLSKCRLLERLSVKESSDLKRLKVTNSSRRLKYLTIRLCGTLREVTLDVESLVSFDFYDSAIDANVVYKNLPSLTEASFGGKYCSTLILNFRQIACFSAHLSRLSLCISMVNKDHVIPTFLNVKHLVLTVKAIQHRSLLPLRCFPEACPLLHYLKLQIVWFCFCEEQSESESEEEYGIEANDSSGIGSGSGTLPNLRKLEWLFVGICKHVKHAHAEIILASYIRKNAIALEEFVCDPPEKYAELILPKIPEH